MLKAIKQKHVYVHPIGDVLAPAEFLRAAPDLLDLTYLPVEFFGLNPWDAVWKAGIDIVELREETLCPFSNLKWVNIVPLGIISHNPQDYASGIPEHIRQMAMDKRWTAQYYKDEPSVIEATVLGTGYSIGRSPYDGYGEVQQFAIDLDNQDMLIVAAHVWFNK